MKKLLRIVMLLALVTLAGCLECGDVLYPYECQAEPVHQRDLHDE